MRCKKCGLVVGNADYNNSKLGCSPLNSARELADILKEKEFTIIHKENLRFEEMSDAVDEFIEVLKENSLSLFYYAGHAVQRDGENYLLPIDINSDKVTSCSLGLSNILKKINNKNPKNIIVILDCCRDYGELFLSENDLVEINSDGKRNLIVFYATSAGEKAYCGEKHDNHCICTK